MKTNPSDFPVSFAFGLDSPTDYGPDLVLESLGGLSLQKAEGPTSEAVQVLFLPSFHPELCLTATLDEHKPQLTLVTMQTTLWYWWYSQMMKARGNWDERDLPPPPPERWQETVSIPADRLAGFHSEFGATNPASLSDTRSRSESRDGMDVQGQYRRVEGTTTVFRHHISPEFPQHYSFVLAVYRLGIDLLRAEQSVRALESLHMYLDLGLPLKLLRGRPLTVRLFGILSSNLEEELRVALARVPEEELVLMDMSNFDGMGTLLYPVFRQFLGRRGRTVWWASPAAEKHLKAMQVPSSCIFHDRDAAVASLASS